MKNSILFNSVVMNIVKSIGKELLIAKNYTCPKELFKSQFWQHIKSVSRKNKLTTAQYCRHKEDLKFVSDSYLAFLQSQRQRQDLIKKYHAKGTRSVEDTAKLVGLKVPEVNGGNRSSK